jgi:hypothetical protein
MSSTLLRLVWLMPATLTTMPTGPSSASNFEKAEST